ncbi:hypothetical protein REPUB_Repub10bG0048100 [Reevesia pubescens]
MGWVARSGLGYCGIRLALLPMVAAATCNSGGYTRRGYCRLDGAKPRDEWVKQMRKEKRRLSQSINGLKVSEDLMKVCGLYLLDELENKMKVTGRNASGVRIERQDQWMYLDTGWIKMNSDGTFSKNTWIGGIGGIGVVVRNDRGKLVGGIR